MGLVAACWFAAAAQPASPDPAVSVKAAIAKSRRLQRTRMVSGELAVARDEARRLLATLSVEDEMFLSAVESVAQLYVDSGWRANGIAVYQDALARLTALPAWHPSRVHLLVDLADEWEQNGNLLKAVPFLEQAAAAQGAAPRDAPPENAQRGQFFVRPIQTASCGERPEPLVAPYIRLAHLYRRLGRMDAAAATAAKLAALGPHAAEELAHYYRMGGNMVESGALFRRVALDSTDPFMAGKCLENAATVFRAAQRLDESIAALRDAISLTEKASDAAAHDRAVSLRQVLAMDLHHAGQTEEGDRIYESLMQQSSVRAGEAGEKADQLAMSYARYLAFTQRAPQAEKFLKGYWNRSGTADSPSRPSVLNQLAAYAEQNGNIKDAAEYRRQAALNPPRAPGATQAEAAAIAELHQVEADFDVAAPEELYGRTLHAIETARPVDLNALAGQVFGIAEKFLASKEPEKANQAFEKMLARAQSNAEDDVNALLQVRRGYIGLLLMQPGRLGGGQAAIDQLRADLIGTDGVESAKLMEPIEREIELAHERSDVHGAEAAGQKMLALEASLTGRSSEPYFNRLDVVAAIYEEDEHYGLALPLRAESVLLADALATPINRERRVTARIRSALTLAHVGKFREAEALAREAVELQKISHAPAASLDPELKKIEDLERAAKGPRL
jgi:hypothetical protein